MLMAIVLGVLSASISVGIWFVFQTFVESTGLNQWIIDHWFVVPACLGVIVSLYVMLRGRRSGDLFNDGLPDLIEEYHFGIQRSPAHRWGFRSLVSFSGSLFGEIFGFEGGVIEGVTALTQSAIAYFPHKFHQAFRHDSDFRQTLIAATMASAFTIIFNAPFAGALLSLEIIMTAVVRVRVAAFASAFAAYGALRFLSSTFNIDRFGFVSTLFEDLKPLTLETPSLLVLSVMTFIVGFLVSGASLGYGHWLYKVQTTMDQKNIPKVALTLGICCILVVMALLTPEAFSNPLKIWQDMSLSQISSLNAVVAWIARAVMLSIALVGLGSSGLVSPLLFIAALVGYSIASVVDTAWSLPIALSCVVAVLAGGFGAPLAGIALVLELTQDGLLLWLAALATAGATLSLMIGGRTSFISILLRRRGIKLVNGQCANVLASLEMKDAMVRDFGTISENSTLADLQRVAGLSRHSVLGVCTSTGEFRGLISLDQLPNNIELKGINMSDFLDRDAIIVKPNDPLEKALPLLTGVSSLAVLDDQKHLVGLVFKTAVLARYQREIGRRALIYYASRRPYNNQ